jgi:hypothetical protein
MNILRLGLLGTLALLLLGACNNTTGEAAEELIPIPEQEGTPLAHMVNAKPHKHEVKFIQPKLPDLKNIQRIRPISAPPVGASSLRAQAIANPRVALRLLLVSATAGETELNTWKGLFDKMGLAYDTFVATAEPDLNPARLIAADGVGRYQAIFLTTNNLSYDSGGGNFISALSNDEWTVLFNYERDYKVRQVALYGAPTTFPEDYCARIVAEQGVEATSYPIRTTTTGASIFRYLKTTAQIPLRFSYLYKASIDSACATANPTQAILQDSAGAVLGVTSRTADGRERMGLFFSSNPFFLYTPMLSYGVIRWATRGLFLGERQHFFNIDNDDWFNFTDVRRVDGTINENPGFRLSASDAANTYNQLQSFRQRWGSLLDYDFAFNIAYNADGANLNAPSSCDSRRINRSPDPLTSVSRCIAGRMRWVNHTFTHINLDQTRWAPYSVVRNEIQENLRVGRLLGINAPTNVFKPGELSGLGFYDPNRTDPFGQIGTPQDFGLGASNTEMLRAATDSGIKFIHSNFSVLSQKPSCHNCGIQHPLSPNLWLIPVRPNNIAYFVTTPEEEVSFFNYFYGPGGLFPFFTTNQNYSQIMDYESDVALFDIMSGSVYANFFHQGNLRQYASGRNLMFDWMNAVMTKYSQYFSQPIHSIDWTGPLAISDYAEARTLHSRLAPRIRGVWNLDTGAVTMTAPGDLGGQVYVTGTGSGFRVTLSGDQISALRFNPGQTISFTRAPQ